MKQILIVLILLSFFIGTQAQQRTPYRHYMTFAWDDLAGEGSKPRGKLPDDPPPPIDTIKPLPDLRHWDTVVIAHQDTIFITGCGPWECRHREIIWKKLL